MRGKIAGAFILALSATLAAAQTYPVKPVRLVVPASPGGGSDITARFLAQKLSEQIGQQFVVENRPGASTLIGVEFVAKSAPDGYTLLVPAAAISVNPSIFAKLPYDTLRDLAPVSQIVESANVLVVHPSVPAKTVKEVIALAKARPGVLAAASPGVSGTPHMAAELFKLMAGVNILVVPYKGSGPGLIALMAGEVPLQFSTPASALPYVRAGRMRALGVTTKARVSAMPDVPTIAEAALPGYEATQWFALFSTGGTPRAIIDRLAQETARAVRSPDLKERLSAEGLEPVGSSADEFGAYLRAEMAKWAKVVKAAGIKPQSF
jgi:tripartite-type tricarboxylate transporter receptor subunit TctC